MRLQAFVVEEWLHQFGEADAVERRGGELEQLTVGEAEGLDAGIGLDRVG